MRPLLLDTEPLRTSPVFRRLWVGRSVSLVGGQMTVVAVMYQVWALTHRPLWSGSVAIAQAVPMTVVGMWGGALVDRVDRRRVLLVAVTGQLALSGVLAAQALWLPSVWVVVPAVAVQSGFVAVGAPAFSTIAPRLFPSEQVAGALALTRVSGQVAMLAGPALAGVLIGWAGVRVCYLVDAASFLAALHGLAGLPAMVPDGSAARRGAAGIVDGLRFLAGQPVVRGVVLLDLATMVLSMPVSLFPLVDQERFGGDPRMLGLLLSAIAVGGVAASLLAGTFTRRRRVGLVMVAGAATWSAAVTLFGTVPWARAALALLALAGAADTVSVVSRSTVVQLAAPDEMRGRISSVEMIVGIAGPDVGNLRGGMVAQWVSAPFALVSGGLTALIALAAIVVTSPGMVGFGPRRPATAVTDVTS